MSHHSSRTKKSSSSSKKIKSLDQAVWVKGETALQHITGKNSKWKLPSPRFQHASVVANGKLMIIGGTQGTIIFDDFWVFDPIRFTWISYLKSKHSSVTDGGRAQHTVTFMQATNKLYLFGGICTTGIANNTLYCMDLNKDLVLNKSSATSTSTSTSTTELNGTFTWHEIGIKMGQEQPKPRFSHCAICVCDRLFIFGGQRGGKKLSNTLFRYDPAASSTNNEIEEDAKGSWHKVLQDQSSKSMAPPPGKDYRMLVIPQSHENSGARHVVVLGTNLKFIYVIPIERETGHPISWDTLGATGNIPGAMVSPSGQQLTPVRRQFAAAVISKDMKIKKNRKGKKIQNECEIIIFGGIVHNPVSSLTDDIHGLILNVVEGSAEWKELPQRGRSVPSARIGHTFSFIEYKSPQTGLINHQMLMFGGTDSNAFRQDFFILDLNTPIEKKDVIIHLANINETEHVAHVLPIQSSLCAPRGATITRLWNTETHLLPKVLKDEGENKEENEDARKKKTIQTAQFLILGGSRSTAAASAESSWTSHDMIGMHDKPNDTQSSKNIARLLTRNLIKNKKKNTNWQLYQNLTLKKEQIVELAEVNIHTFYGHTTTLFADENMVVVYGGATADEMLLPQGDNVWILWLGDPNEGGIQNWSDLGKRRRAAMNAADGGNGGGNGGGDDGGDSDGKSGARSDRSDKTTTSGSSGDTSGGSDSDIGNNNRFHPVGVDLRTDGQHNDSNDTTNKNAKKKKKKKIQKLPHPRTKMKWEMININWPDETNADEDANGDRIGHACAKYGEWLYVIGGCATGHTYKSDIFKLHVSELDVNNNNNFAFQSTPGCTYERCDPVQKYDDLYYNMMTPRAGHTVTARGSNFYIYGGGMDGFVEDSNMYCFDAETYVWTNVETEGATPPGRYNHAACMAGGSLANKLIISGGIGNLRPTEEDVKKYFRAKQKNVMTPTPVQFKDRVLHDVWTFDLSGKIWSEVGVPDMSPMYGHLMCMFDNRDTKLFLYGGGDDSNKLGHSLEIDLVPSWSKKHKEGKKKLKSKKKKKAKILK